MENYYKIYLAKKNKVKDLDTWSEMLEEQKKS